MNKRVPLFLFTAAVACDSHDHAGATPAAEACEHLAAAASHAVTAVAPGGTAALPDMTKPHVRADVTLPADASGTFAGEVKFLSAAKGSYLLLTNVDVAIQVADSAGKAVDQVAAPDPCSGAAVRKVVALDVATYKIRIGPAKQAKVGLMIEKL